MDGSGLDVGEFALCGRTSMGWFCCFPKLTRWFEGFQRLDVNDHDVAMGGHEGGQMVTYRDITQQFLEETNSTYFFSSFTVYRIFSN